jgi:hypothetical protein
VDCHIRWWNWEFERAKVFQLLLNLENIIKYKNVTDVVSCMLSPYFLVCSWACAWNLQIIHAFPFLANYTYAVYGLWNLNLAQLMIWSASNTELFGDIFSCLIFHSPFSIKLDGFHSSIWWNLQLCKSSWKIFFGHIPEPRFTFVSMEREVEKSLLRSNLELTIQLWLCRLHCCWGIPSPPCADRGCTDIAHRRLKAHWHNF